MLEHIVETEPQQDTLTTRQRIVQTALALFNQQGERDISTNHIAAHLNISPGNLYYHFANKQAIVAELFSQYEQLIAQFLQRPTDRALTIADKAVLLEAILTALWRYRFFHRDMQHLLVADVQLAERYRLLAQRCLADAKDLYQGFADAGILQVDAAGIEALVLNAWLLLTAWIPFVHSMQAPDAELTPAILGRVIYQVLMLERDYISADARPELALLLEKYHVPLSEVLPIY